MTNDFITFDDDIFRPKCFLLAEIDSCGNWVREKHFKRGEGSGIDMDHCGNLIISGFSFEKYEIGKSCYQMEDDFNVFISKLDRDWNTQWMYSFPYDIRDDDNLTIVNELSINLTLDEWDNIYADSLFGNPLKIENNILIPQQSPDKFVLKLDNNGCFKWVVQISGTRETYGKEVSVDPFGNVYAAVSFFNPLSIDLEPVSYTYSETLGVIKLSQKFPHLLGVVTEVTERCSESDESYYSCSESECNKGVNIIPDVKVGVVFTGLVDVFGCLSPGKRYYLDLEGCLTLDSGFRYFGTAISDSQLLIGF